MNSIFLTRTFDTTPVYAKYTKMSFCYWNKYRTSQDSNRSTYVCWAPLVWQQSFELYVCKVDVTNAKIMDWAELMLKAIPKVLTLSLTKKKMKVRKPSNFRSGTGMTMVTWWKATWSFCLEMMQRLKNTFSLNVSSKVKFLTSKTNLKSNEILLHVNYSENYKSKI